MTVKIPASYSDFQKVSGTGNSSIICLVREESCARHCERSTFTFTSVPVGKTVRKMAEPAFPKTKRKVALALGKVKCQIFSQD